MAEDVSSKPRKAMDTFPCDFVELKPSVIRPALETVGNTLKARGHEINISEDASGRISIHIVPAGARKSTQDALCVSVHKA